MTRRQNDAMTDTLTRTDLLPLAARNGELNGMPQHRVNEDSYGTTQDEHETWAWWLESGESWHGTYRYCAIGWIFFDKPQKVVHTIAYRLAGTWHVNVAYDGVIDVNTDIPHPKARIKRREALRRLTDYIARDYKCDTIVWDIAVGSDKPTHSQLRSASEKAFDACCEGYYLAQLTERHMDYVWDDQGQRITCRMR